MKKLMGAMAAIGLMGVLAGTASAQIWWYEAYGGFNPDPSTISVDPFPLPMVASPLDGVLIEGEIPHTQLLWGSSPMAPGAADAPLGQSSAVINWADLNAMYGLPVVEQGKIENYVVANSSSMLFVALTYFDQPMDESNMGPDGWDSWGTAELLYQFDLYDFNYDFGNPGPADPTPVESFTYQIPVNFWESKNDKDPPAVIQFGDSPPHETQTRTDDLFFIPISDIEETFMYGDSEYVMKTSGWFEAPTISGMPQEYFWTDEQYMDGQSFVVGFTIDQMVIPEPGTVGLLLFGALGLGYASRRRRG